MAHIIIKSRTPANIHGKPAHEDLGGGPFVIDFRERRKAVPASFLLAALAIFCSFFFSALIAIVLITKKSDEVVRHLSAPPPLVQEDVPSSFALEPLPSRALIMGRDFQHGRSAEKGRRPLPEKELVPLLEKLPLYGPAPSRKTDGITIDVQPLAQADAATLAREADAAYAEGDMDEAVKAAAAALAMAPQDSTLRQNLVSLLLEQAKSYEETGEWEQAKTSYDRALKAIKGQGSLREAIAARRDYVARKTE